MAQMLSIEEYSKALTTVIAKAHKRNEKTIDYYASRILETCSVDPVEDCVKELETGAKKLHEKLTELLKQSPLWIKRALSASAGLLLYGFR